MPEIHLITQYFLDPKRKDELEFCLQKNLDNQWITQIHLLNEKKYLFNSPKIIQKVVEKRITYQMATDYANSLPGKLCVICNADIFFDDTLGLITTIEMKNKMLALLRWEYQSDGSAKILHDKRADMQDAWIFLSPLPTRIKCPHKFGIPGCENNYAYEVNNARVEMYNPCHDIKAYHFHREQMRSYEPRIGGPYHYVEPLKPKEFFLKRSPGEIPR